jgi:flavorubredoxin
VLKKIEKVVDFEEIRYNIQSHNSVDHLFLDPILRKTHITKQQKKIDSE